MVIKLNTKNSRIDARISRVVREQVGLRGDNRYDIEVVDGFAEPKVTEKAKAYYYTTPGGKPVYYPNAYRRAWGKPVYNSAYRGTITVGAGWICEHAS